MRNLDLAWDLLSASRIRGRFQYNEECPCGKPTRSVWDASREIIPINRSGNLYKQILE